MTPGDSQPQSRNPVAHAIMFWVLTVMALGVFAACVLVPIGSDAEQVRAYEARIAARIAELEARKARNQARIDALLADPLVNERIIRREFNYHPASEQVVVPSAEELAAIRVALPEPDAVAGLPRLDPPAWVSAVARWLPAWPWQKLFGRGPHRTLMLLMAAGLIAAAFLLYHPSTGALGKRAFH